MTQTLTLPLLPQIFPDFGDPKRFLSELFIDVAQAFLAVGLGLIPFLCAL